MKKKLKATKITLAASIIAFAFAGAGTLIAEEKGHEGHEGHDHAEHAEEGHEEAKAGPNGGKVIHEVEPHLEFFVTEDRKVRITALDEGGKAAPIGEQSVSIIAGDRSNPTRMAFAKEGEVLVSDKAFPEGNDFPVVVQIKTTPDAKTVIEKFNLNLMDCPTCEHQEYACTCDHGEDGHEGHDH
ncbi:MAG: hypothetical protein ACSHX9_00480 [Luteolibacter sp.]